MLPYNDTRMRGQVTMFARDQFVYYSPNVIHVGLQKNDQFIVIIKIEVPGI